MDSKKSYLLIKKPLTTNGVNMLVIDGRVQYKTVTAPLNAKLDFEKDNESRPDGLKYIIEVVHPDPITLPNRVEVEQKVKPGPKPKSNDLA